MVVDLNAPAVLTSDHPYAKLQTSSTQEPSRWSRLKISSKSLLGKIGNAAKTVFQQPHVTGPAALLSAGGIAASAICGSPTGVVACVMHFCFFGQLWVDHPNPAQRLQETENSSGFFAKLDRNTNRLKIAIGEVESTIGFETYVLSGLVTTPAPEIGIPMCAGVIAAQIAIKLDSVFTVANRTIEDIIRAYKETYGDITIREWLAKHKYSLGLMLATLPGNILPYILPSERIDETTHVALTLLHQYSALMLGRPIGKFTAFCIMRAQVHSAEVQDADMLRSGLKTASWLAQNPEVLIAAVYATMQFGVDSSFLLTPLGFAQGLREESSEQWNTIPLPPSSPEKISIVIDKDTPLLEPSEFIQTALPKKSSMPMRTVTSTAILGASILIGTWATISPLCECSHAALMSGTATTTYGILKAAHQIEKYTASRSDPRSRLINKMSREVIHKARYYQYALFSTAPPVAWKIRTLAAHMIPAVQPLPLVLTSIVWGSLRDCLDEGYSSSKNNPHPGIMHESKLLPKNPS